MIGFDPANPTASAGGRSRFGGARTRADARIEHAAAEKPPRGAIQSPEPNLEATSVGLIIWMVLL